MDMKQEGVGTLLRHICNVLGKFADKSLAGEQADKETGVTVQFNRHQRNEVALVFHTHDKITVRVVYDMNKTSRDYIENMVGGVIKHLEKKRKERAESVILLPSASLTRAITQASMR